MAELGWEKYASLSFQHVELSLCDLPVLAIFLHTFEMAVAITPPHAQNLTHAMPRMQNCKYEHLS